MQTLAEELMGIPEGLFAFPICNVWKGVIWLEGAGSITTMKCQQVDSRGLFFLFFFFLIKSLPGELPYVKDYAK